MCKKIKENRLTKASIVWQYDTVIITVISIYCMSVHLYACKLQVPVATFPEEESIHLCKSHFFDKCWTVIKISINKNIWTTETTTKAQKNLKEDRLHSNKSYSLYQNNRGFWQRWDEDRLCDLQYNTMALILGNGWDIWEILTDARR